MKIVLNTTKKPFVKMLFMLICMSKSKQPLNFRDTLFSFFIYLTEWIQQQTKFTTKSETTLASLSAFP